ncbi:MAG: sodium-dependent transporter [Myxococcales bacterium]|nr:sodium-dependent transporter [Myxococcales bacterium]
MASGREQWSSRSGFVLAAVGSAVGLGNMWRFSYLTAENGGAAFVILYLLVTLIVAVPVLLAEVVIGRGSQQSPIRALAHYGGRAWRPVGFVFVAAGVTILAYYGVIAGWTVRYAGMALFGGFDSGIADRFDDIAQGADAFGFHLLFMGVTIGIVAGGVTKGIERTAMVLMPVLFVIVSGLAVYAATLDGAAAGYAYYLSADFSQILSLEVLTEASGQAFFSLSLGMGCMLTFGSYLGRDTHLPRETALIAAADVGVAFVAGLVVFPLIFALGLSDKVGGSTVGALFITLPQAFAEMGPIGRGVGLLFFASLVVGALTSAISLLEVVVSTAIDGFGWERRRAALTAGAAITALGIPAAWSLGVLDVMDQVANNLFLLGGGLALSIFVGWRMEDPIGEAKVGAAGVTWFPMWRNLLRYVVPVVLAFVLYDAVPKTLSAVWGLFVGE